MTVATLKSAAAKLEKFPAAKTEVMVGFDGFVDSIIHVVDKRINVARYTRVETIAAFSKRIGRAAGFSSNIELIVRQCKLGGNGPIMANALLQQGLGVTYVGSLGRGAVHPVFQDMTAKCREFYSLTDAAGTDALEFLDGKLMLNKLDILREVSYARILEVIGLKKLRQIWERSRLVAMTNWTMLPLQTGIWKGLLKDMAGVKTPANALLFVDLTDPEKRQPKELAAACRLLTKFRSSRRVVLGLNQRESLELSRALGLSVKPDEIEANAERVRKALNLDMVVIHPTKNAACATAAGTAILTGPYCAKPKLTTGAGDNFNAGFCLGLLAGLEGAELLASGTACSGFYVRNARSASLPELCAFLNKWAAGKLKD